MKKKRTKSGKCLCLILLLVFALPAMKSEAQVLGVKTNALAWGAWGSANLGVDVGIAKSWSFEVSGIYNPFSWKDNKKTNIWGFQPEVRFWPRYRYAGHFFGLHGHYAQYDWGVKTYVYKGSLYGGGISYGYAWMISERWNIEATAGFGYTTLEHDSKYIRKEGKIAQVPHATENKWNLTRLGISITYFIK